LLPLGLALEAKKHPPNSQNGVMTAYRVTPPGAQAVDTLSLASLVAFVLGASGVWIIHDHLRSLCTFKARGEMRERVNLNKGYWV
jgi:hypothetical protein